MSNNCSLCQVDLFVDGDNNITMALKDPPGSQLELELSVPGNGSTGTDNTFLVVMDTDSQQDTYTKAWIPTLVLAMAMLVFLAISFLKFHRKIMAKRHVQSEYLDFYVSNSRDLDHGLSPRVGSMRAGSSIRSSSDEYGTEPHDGQVALIRYEAETGQSDNDGSSVSRPYSQRKLPHIHSKKSGNKVTKDGLPKLTISQQDIPFADESECETPKEKTSHKSSSRKKKRKFLKHHSDDPTSTKVTNYKDSEVQTREKQYETSNENIHHVSDSKVIRFGRSFRAASAPNINTDNSPFFAEDVEYRAGRAYRSNSYYEECGLAIPTPPKKKRYVKKQHGKTGKDERHLTKEDKPAGHLSPKSSKMEFPELTHRDSKVQLTGKLARSLPVLEEAYHVNVNKKAASDEGLILRVNQDEPRTLGHQYELDIHTSSAELYPSRRQSTDNGLNSIGHGIGMPYTRAQSENALYT